MVRTLSENEAEQYVIGILSAHGPMTTKSIADLARKEGKRCPDETVLFLTKLKSKGVIRGEISSEKRGWLWWV